MIKYIQVNNLKLKIFHFGLLFCLKSPSFIAEFHCKTKFKAKQFY